MRRKAAETIAMERCRRVRARSRDVGNLEGDRAHFSLSSLNATKL